MNGIDIAPAAPPRPGGTRTPGPRAADGDGADFAAALQSALTGDALRGRRNADEAAQPDTDVTPTDQVAALTGGPPTTTAPVATTPVPGVVAGVGTAAPAQGAVAPPDVTVTTTLAVAPTGGTATSAPTAGTAAGTTAVGVDDVTAMPARTNGPDDSAVLSPGLVPSQPPTRRATDGAAVPDAPAARQPAGALTPSAVPAAHGHTSAAAPSGGTTAAAATDMAGTALTDTWMTPTTMTETPMTTATTATTTATATTATTITPTTTTDASGAVPTGTSAPQGTLAGPAAGTHMTTQAQAPAPVPVVVGPYPLDQLGPVSGILAGRLRAGEGAHTLVVQVNPAALGPVRVSASLRNGSLSIELSGGADAARDAMRSSLGDLVAALSGSGVDAVVTVNESRHSDAGARREGDGGFDLSRNAGDGSGRGADTGGRGRGDLPVLPASGVPAQPPRPADARPATASRIDVRI